MRLEGAAFRTVDLARVAAAERGLGVVWTVKGDGDLDANSVRF